MIQKFFDTIDSVTDWIIIVTTIAMCAIIFLQVVCRYAFSYALPWPEEIGRFLFLWLTYFGISAGMKRRGHLCMDIFILYLPQGMKRFLSLLAMVITAGFFLFIVYAGVDMTMKMFRINQLAVALPLPIWIVWAGIPLAAFCTFLQCCRNIFLLASGAVTEAGA